MAMEFLNVFGMTFAGLNIKDFQMVQIFPCQAKLLTGPANKK